MGKLRYILIFLLFGGFSLQTVFGQDFQKELQQLVETNAKSYVSPAATGLGMSMNSGVYRTAKVHKLLGFDVAVNFAAFAVPKDKTTYNVALPDINFTYNNTSVSLNGNELYGGTTGMGPEAQTLFGEKTKTTRDPDMEYARNKIASDLGADPNSQEVSNLVQQYATQLVLPGGIGFRYGFFPNAQVAVGLPMGTELQLRFSPTISMPRGLGDFNMFGAGARISIDQFIPIPLFPIDIAAGVFFQKTDMGPISMNSSLIHAEVSRSLPIVTVYGGLGFEKSALKVDYTIDSQNPALNGTRVKFKINGDDAFRATVGARLKFLIFNLNADYSIGAFSVANLGLGLSFR